MYNIFIGTSDTVENSYTNININSSTAVYYDSIIASLPGLVEYILSECSACVDQHPEVFRASLEDRMEHQRVERRKAVQAEEERQKQRQLQLQNYTCQVELLLRKVCVYFIGIMNCLIVCFDGKLDAISL